MLISHKHKFIFVHIYKNAGSSIRTALLPFAYSNVFHKFFLNVCGTMRIRPPVPLNPEPCRNKHSRVPEIIRVIGEKAFDEYFSFAIIRNPWDWQVSLFNYMRKTPTHHRYEKAKDFPDFASYLHWRCIEEVRYQKDFIYSPDGKLLVDFVGRYENINQDFRSICERIGIRTDLPVINVSKSRPYQEYYTPELIELVRETFAPDIELFGYDFEEAAKSMSGSQR